MADKTDKTTIEDLKQGALDVLDAVKNNQLNYLDTISKASQEALDNYQNAEIEKIKLSLVKSQSDLWVNAIMDMLIFTPILSVVGKAARGMFKSALTTRKAVLMTSKGNLIIKSLRDIDLQTKPLVIKEMAYLTPKAKNIYEFFGPIVDSGAQKFTKTLVASTRLKGSTTKSSSVVIAGIKEDIDNWIIRNRNTTRVTFSRIKNLILSGAYKEKHGDFTGAEYQYFANIIAMYQNLIFSVPQLPLVRSEIEKLIWLTVLPERIGEVVKIAPYGETITIGGTTKFIPPSKEIKSKTFVRFEFSDFLAEYLMNNLYSKAQPYPYIIFRYADLSMDATSNRERLLKELNEIRKRAKDENVIQLISLKKINNL